MPGARENMQDSGEDINHQTDQTNPSTDQPAEIRLGKDTDWECLTPDEKIKRLRVILRAQVIEVELMEYKIKKLKEKLASHDHNKYGEVIYVTPAKGFESVPEDIFTPDQNIADTINRIRESKFF